MMNSKTIKKHLEALGSADVSERKHTAETLSEGDERVIYPLIMALFDESPAVQEAAMYSLISIGGEVVAYMSIPVLRKEAAQRNAALVILKELGPVSVPLLYDLLNDRDDDMKKFTLDLLGEIREGVDIESITPMLGDGNPNVRAAAAGALGHIGARDAVEHLEKSLTDEEWVAFTALEALGEIGDEGAVEAIAKLLTADAPALQYAAIETLGKIPSSHSKDKLLKHIREGDDFTRKVAVKSIIHLGVEPDMPHISDELIAMLDSEDEDDRLLAIEGIKVMRDERAIIKMIDIAGSYDPGSPDYEEKIYLLTDAILSVGDCDSLLRILRCSELRFRGQAILIELIGKAGCTDAVPDLLPLLKDSFRDIRRAVAGTLGEIADSSIVPSLIEALQDKDGHVRVHVVKALRRLEDERAFEPLKGLMEREKYENVLEEVVKTLLLLDTQRLLGDFDSFTDSIRMLLAKYCDDQEIILKLTGDENSEIRSNAIMTLTYLDIEDAEERLNKILKDPDPEIRKVAVMGIEQSGRFSDALIPALYDRDMWVRFYAIKAISATDGENHVKELIDALRDSEVPIVMCAMDALAEIGGSEVCEALRSMSEYPEQSVQERAVELVEFIS